MTDTRTGTAPAVSTDRLVSLDVFRGITMAAMVIVNNPGDWDNAYPPLLHAAWNGWTLTDLIFPFFLFIVGVAMTLSRGTMGGRGRIVRRGLTIIGLGLFLSGFPYFRLATWRIPGVLFRIGVCYLAAAAIFRTTAPRGEANDLRHAVRLGIWVLALTLGYWAVMVLVPFPGHVTGDLSPAGNLGVFVDRAIISKAHMWKQQPYDPEGILSTLPAIATTLLGILTGLWLRARYDRSEKAMLMASAGVAGIALGLVWDLAFPINKSIWTSSYVFFTGGAGALMLAGCYWMIDVKGWRAWTKPFVILGMNAIALFVLSGLSEKLFIVLKVQDQAGKWVSLQSYVYQTWYAPLAAPKNSSLLFALTYLAVLYVILWAMYRRRIFLKV